MMEHAPQIKRDEQYPLLKVEGGGGDNVMRAQITPNIMNPGWQVACAPKQSWCSRWPEFVSACWMTAILFAISFLVFYVLGMSAYRRQPVVIIRCNDSKPASDVYYHHILPRDTYVPFSLFSEYLSFMAKQYPMLRFNVYFLFDDSWPNSVRSSSHLRFLKKLVPQITGSFNTNRDQNYRREIKEFQRRYQNVNISIMFLSKYMAMTPLKFEWKTIPLSYLPFYARIYAIWQNGGIGFDLVSFNNNFNKNHPIDRRIDAILKLHNDGIKSEKYAETFNSIDNEEQNELFSMFFNLINQIFNETCSYFGSNATPDIKLIDNDSLVRTHRSKRNVNTSIPPINDTNNLPLLKLNPNNQSTEGYTNKTNIINYHETNISNEMNNSNHKDDHGFIKSHKILDLLKMPNISDLNADMPQVLLFYDVSVFSDDIGPPYSFSKQFAPPGLASIKNSELKHGQSKSKYLSLTPEGHFVAASSGRHPFLAQLFSVGCRRINPQYAIKNTLLSQCSGFLRDDVYCENIRIMYNVM